MIWIQQDAEVIGNFINNISQLTKGSTIVAVGLVIVVVLIQHSEDYLPKGIV